MRFASGFGFVSFVALIALGIPSTAMADHCGAMATVSPRWGPPGATFVFRTNLGAPSDLYLFRDGRRVKTDYLPGGGGIRYVIRTNAADRGRWRVRAEVRGSPACAAQAWFTVGGAPDTDAGAALDAVDAGPPSPLILVTAALTSFWMALRRLGGRGYGANRMTARILRVALAGPGAELVPSGLEDAAPRTRGEVRPATARSATAEQAPLLLLVRISVGRRRGRDHAAEDR